jgi:hypothetical protein
VTKANIQSATAFKFDSKGRGGLLGWEVKNDYFPADILELRNVTMIMKRYDQG